MKITVTRRIEMTGSKAIQESAQADEPRLAFASAESELAVAEEIARHLFSALPAMDLSPAKIR